MAVERGFDQMMKRRRLPLSCLLTACLLIMLVVFPIVVIWRGWRQEQQDQALIAAIKQNDLHTALETLEAGADANAREKEKDTRSFWNRLLALFPHRDPPARMGSTALLIALEPLPPSGDRYDSFYHFRPENTLLVSALLRHGARVDIYSAEFNHHDNALQGIFRSKMR